MIHAHIPPRPAHIRRIPAQFALGQCRVRVVQRGRVGGRGEPFRVVVWIDRGLLARYGWTLAANRRGGFGR